MSLHSVSPYFHRRSPDTVVGQSDQHTKVAHPILRQMAASFADSKPLVDDFCVVLQSDDTEQGLLGDLARHRSSLEAASATHAANAKHIIGELQRRARQTETQAAAAAPSIDELRAKLAQIESRRTALAAEVARLRQQKDTSSAALQALTQQMASLKQASATLVADHTSQVPRVK